MSAVTKCSVAPDHGGYTRHSSHLCVNHRPVELEETLSPEEQMEEAVNREKLRLYEAHLLNSTWPLPDNVDDATDYYMNLILDSVSALVHNSALRWFNTIDYADYQVREKAAYELREYLIRNLIPNEENRSDYVLQQIHGTKDQYGESFDGVRVSVNFILTRMWHLLKSNDFFQHGGYEGTPTLQEWMETVFNQHIVPLIIAEFGKKIQIFPQIIQTVSRRPALNTQLFSPMLSQKADTFVQQPVAQTGNRSSGWDKLKVGLAIADVVVQGSINNSDNKKDAKLQKMRDYNTQIQYDRNRKNNSWFG